MTKKILLFAAILLLALPAAGWAKRVAVTVPIANVRSGPGINYDIIWKVEQYHPLVVIKKARKWYRFKDFEGDEGWISQSVVGSIPTVISKKNKANVRSGPGTQYPVVFTIDKGIPFRVYKRKGKWIKIKHSDGDRGWIFHTLVW